jgi:hypothetical protein
MKIYNIWPCKCKKTWRGAWSVEHGDGVSEYKKMINLPPQKNLKEVAKSTNGARGSHKMGIIQP